MIRKRTMGPATIALALLIAMPIAATTVLRMNLEDMVNRSERIFRGTVQDFRTGTIEVGGGTVPTVTYVVQVQDALKGDLGAKEHGLIEFTMVGTIKDAAPLESGMQKLSALPRLPEYRVGGDYLILLTPESQVGLCTSVGLEQGTFTIFNQDHQAFAVNALSNQNLGSGIDGPIRYDELAQMIRDLTGE